MTPPRRQHPTLSDVALALANRHTSPTSKVAISDANARMRPQVSVEVVDADPKVAAEKASALYKVLRADLDKAFPPRENGGETK